MTGNYSQRYARHFGARPGLRGSLPYLCPQRFLPKVGRYLSVRCKTSVTRSSADVGCQSGAIMRSQQQRFTCVEVVLRFPPLRGQNWSVGTGDGYAAAETDGQTCTLPGS